jgi:hypothetical protein
VIGGRGGYVLHSLGPPAKTLDEELTPQALQLRKIRRALSSGERRPVPVLKGQQLIGGLEEVVEVDGRRIHRGAATA